MPERRHYKKETETQEIICRKSDVGRVKNVGDGIREVHDIHPCRPAQATVESLALPQWSGQLCVDKDCKWGKSRRETPSGRLCNHLRDCCWLDKWLDFKYISKPILTGFSKGFDMGCERERCLG